MVIGRAVVEGVAAMPPGPGLADVLAWLDLALVPNDDIVEVLIAQSRQLAHDQARMWATMTEVIHRLPFAGPLEVRRGDGPELYGADEVRAALAWSRRAAERETELGFTVVCGLPLVYAALLEGSIDRSKAVVFGAHLSDLSVAQIEAVCAAVLPVAGRLTPGQLGERLKRLVLELDPGYYQRRYRKAVRDRMLFGYLDHDGTATITAKGLPAEEAAAALERVDVLARAVRRAGHPGTLDQLRADIALGLLDGSLHHLTRAQIIEALLGRGEPDPQPTDPQPTDPQPTDPQQAGPEPASGAPDSGAPDGGAPDSGAPGGAPDGGALAGGVPAAGGVPSAGLTGGGTRGGGPRGGAPGGGVPGRGGGATPAAAGQRVGVEIRVPLSTLLGRDDRAGQIPGLGPVPASAARSAVRGQRRAQWRWVVLDAAGGLLSEGITRRRPADLPRGGPVGGIVELQVPAAELAGLAADPAGCGSWAAVVVDIAAQHARHQHDPGAALRDLDAHPRDRFPRAALRRHVQVRDRCCVHPGCRAAARRADADHTLDHARAGTTTTDDLGPLCRHDHTLKTEGGWGLCQPEPGRFLWTSPLGRVYPVAPEPILPPPPAQITREPEPWFDEPAHDTDEPLRLRHRSRAPPPPPPPTDTTPAMDRGPCQDADEDPPPF